MRVMTHLDSPVSESSQGRHAEKHNMFSSCGKKTKKHNDILVFCGWFMMISTTFVGSTPSLFKCVSQTQLPKRHVCFPIQKIFMRTSYFDWLVVGNIFPYFGNFIIPTDELIFFKGVGIPPTRFVWPQPCFPKSPIPILPQALVRMRTSWRIATF